MSTQQLFSLLVLAVALQRLWEVSVSRRHTASLLAQGGREHAAGQMPWMVLIHAGWLASMLIEVWLGGRAFVGWLALVALLLFGVGQTLRIWAMRTLGTRWTVKVITLPDAAPVAAGPFRFLRHPNYLGVMLEIAALPLVHGAYVTALVFTLANAVLLRFRIRAEERALDHAGHYEQAFQGRPRLVPFR